MNDSTNAFHWTLENARADSDKTAQSYAFGKDPRAHQFYTGDETFGPRRTSLIHPQRVPLLLVRPYEKGEVAVAQLSACRFPARAEPPQFLRQFVNKSLRWASLSSECRM